MATTARQRRKRRLERLRKTDPVKYQRTIKARRTKRRERRDAKNPLYNPSLPLQGSELKAAVKALVGGELDPQLRALQSEEGQVTRQYGALGRNASSYYQKLAADEAQNLNQSRVLADKLNATLKGVGDETQASGQRTAQEADQRAQQDVSLRGGGLEGGARASIAQEQAALQSRAGSHAQAFRSAGALQAAGQGDYQGALAGSRKLRGGEIQQQLLNRVASQVAKIGDTRRETEAKRGPMTTETLLKLRQQGFENLAIQQEFGLKGAELQSKEAQAKADRALAGSRVRETKRSNRAQERIAGQRIGATVRGQDLNHLDRVMAEEGRKARDKGKGAKPRFTNVQKRDAKQQYDRALSLMRSHADAKKHLKRAKKKGKFPQNYWLNALVNQGIPKPLAAAALQMFIFKSVGKGVRHSVYKYHGIRLQGAKH